MNFNLLKLQDEWTKTQTFYVLQSKTEFQIFLTVTSTNKILNKSLSQAFTFPLSNMGHKMKLEIHKITEIVP